MSTVASLRTQVNQLRKRLLKEHEPRQWSFLLEEGEELPDSILAKIGEHDQVYIRHTPKVYLRTDKGDYCIGYVTSAVGTLIVYPDGRLISVPQDTVGRKRG